MSAVERASKESRVELAQRVSGASKRANGRVSGPVLQTVFLVILAHSVAGKLMMMVIDDEEDVGPQVLD